MYIHGELKRYGFNITEIHHFGDPEKCHIDYEFKNDNIRAVINRCFDGKITLTYSDHDSQGEGVFTVEHIEDEAHIILLVRDFLAKHA